MRRTLLATAVAATLPLALEAAAAAAQVDGTLDPTFDLDGSARVAFDLPASTFRDVPVAVAVQPDGGVVVAGAVDDGTLHRDAGVARLTPAGALDPGFGTGGKYVGQFIYDEIPSAVRVRDDGSILVAGSWETVPPGSPSVWLRVLSAAGFPVGGVGIPVNGALIDPRVGLAHDQAGGKIYLAYSRQVATTPTIAVWRLNEDLTTDNGYGTGGLLDIEHLLGVPLYVRALALDGEGRLVVGATEGGAGGLDFCVMRATSAGELDATFGGGSGYQTVPIELVANGDDDLQGLAVDALGRILLSGAASAPGFDDDAAVLVRLTAAGPVDPAFNGGAPLVVADTDGDDALGGLVVQSDGRIVVAGKVFGPASPMFFAARYLDDGSADWSFGSFGVVTANFPNSPNDDYAVALALQAGRPILVGPAEWSAPDYDFGVMRLNGSLVLADDLERGSTGAWSARVP